MKSILIVIVGFVCIAIAVVGCSQEGEIPLDSKGRIVLRDYAELCVNGVVYYREHYILTPKFLPDSTVEICE
jgi:hypothetical protein